MTSLARATAAPVELNINGNVYRLSPLKEKDWGEIEQWMRSRAMQVARENLDGFSGEDRKVLLEAAYDRAAKASITSPDFNQLMASREGAARMVWMGLRANHPNVTMHEISEWIIEPKILDQFMGQFDDVNELKSAAGNGQKKTRKKRSPSTGGKSIDTSPSDTASTPTK